MNQSQLGPQLTRLFAVEIIVEGQSDIALRDQQYITSTQGLGGRGQKSGNFCCCSLLFMLTKGE